MVDSTLLIGANSQGLDTQIKGDNFTKFGLLLLAMVAKGSVVGASCISGDCYLTKFSRWFLGEHSLNVRIGLVLPSSSSWQDQHSILNREIASWIAESEEAMSWSHSGEPWLLSSLEPSEKSIHGSS